MKKVAIVLAGGKGLRMGADLPKQFLVIAGKPILMHTLEAFHSADANIQLVLVLPSEQRSYWEKLCLEYNFSLEHLLVDGGETRFDSVRNGLRAIEGECLVAVHDGVRPLVSPQLIHTCFEIAARDGAVVPVRAVVESLREVGNSQSKALDRSRYVSVQTPQTFQGSLLLKAYEQPYSSSFTDDASVVEASGHKVTLVEGDPFNLKITTPMDLILAEHLIKA